MRARFVNESEVTLSPQEKREEVMRIMTDRNLYVPSGSYVKFHDLSLTELTPEEIVRELLKESVSFERGMDPKSSMRIGLISQLEDLKEMLEKELEWNGANVTVNDDGTLLYTCYPGNSVISDIKDVIEKFGWGDMMKVNIADPWNSRSYDTGAPEHEYLISFKKPYARKFGLTESVNFQRGKDPKQAMGIGEWADGYLVEYDPYGDHPHPPERDVITWGNYDWNKKAVSPEDVEGSTPVTKDIYREVEKLPLIVFKGWNNMTIGGQEYFGLFGDWGNEEFRFYDTPFVARVEDDEEERNFLVAPEGYDYARYMTELV